MTLPNEFWRQLPQRADADLYDMLIHDDDYLPEAITAVKEELRRRNLPQDKDAFLRSVAQARKAKVNPIGGQTGEAWASPAPAGPQTSQSVTQLPPQKLPAVSELHDAAWAGDLAKVQQLLAGGADVHAKDKLYGKTPLHDAAYGGHIAMVELLLTRGADVNAKDAFGKTPLHAAVGERFTELVELLLSKGADVNARNMYGATPLHFARYIEVIRLLLAKGADINAQEDNGRRRLHYAHLRGESEIAELLRQHGAEWK